MKTTTATPTVTVSLQTPPRILTDTQQTAVDLYERGLNVFPIKKASKEPFIVRPLFTARMHHCTPACTHKGRVDFTPLFERANLALMTGKTSKNLFAIDCDSQSAFETLGRELDVRALAYWAYTGHRGGTYLLFLAEGEAANQAEGQTPFDHVQIWGHSHYVVIPPSIHPAGTVYTWTKDPAGMPARAILPAVSVEDLSWLGVALAKSGKKWEAPELYGLPEWGMKLSHKARQVYAYGANDGNRNYALARLAYDMAGADVPQDEALIYLETAASRCTPAYDQNPKPAAILKSAYKEPRKQANEYTAERAPAKDWEKAQAFAQSFDWRATFGRRALTRQAVYLACVERSRLDNSGVFRAAVREISQLANVSKQVAGDSLRDLSPASDHNPGGAGLICWVGSNQYNGANLYAFVLPTGYIEPSTVITTCSNSVLNSIYPKTEAEQNVFSRLGSRAYQVWKYLLLHDAKSRREIAKKAEIPYSSVHQAITNLLGTNPPLVTYSPAEGVYCGEGVTDQTLQRMAADEGINKVQDRREAYRLDRELLVNRKIARARSITETVICAGEKP